MMLTPFFTIGSLDMAKGFDYIVYIGKIIKTSCHKNINSDEIYDEEVLNQLYSKLLQKIKKRKKVLICSNKKIYRYFIMAYLLMKTRNCSFEDAKEIIGIKKSFEFDEKMIRILIKMGSRQTIPIKF